MRKRITISFLFFLVTICVLPAQDFFKTGLHYGKYPVGFKAVNIVDWSRPSLAIDKKTSSGREMNIHIWYPANKLSGKTMAYKEYVALNLPPHLSVQNASLAQVIIQTVSELSGDTSLFKPIQSLLLSSPTKAYNNANVAAGKFPIVFFPDRPHVQSIMCEYIASQGYIVVSPVIKGAYTNLVEYNIAGIETAVQDLQYALGYVRQHFTTIQEFSVMGLGFSATNALAWQMRNPDIKAYISLEGGITTGFEEQLIQRSPFFDVQRCITDMLIIHAPHPDVRPELTYKYKYANRIYQRYAQSSEFYFLNFGIWEKVLPNIFKNANRGNTWVSFEQAAISIVRFLNWKLKGVEDEKQKLIASQTEIMEVTVKKASSIPPTAEQLKNLIQQKGINAVSQLYKQRKETDDQPFTFATFFMVGQQFIQQSVFSDLKVWGELFSDAYPNSAIPYTMQARAYLETGNRETAKNLYLKAQQLLDNDENLNTEEKKAYKVAIQNRLSNF